MFFSKSSAAAKENEKAVNSNANALENQIKTREKANKALNEAQAQELAMAKATGKSTSAIRALELQLIQKSLADVVASRNAAMHTIELEKQSLAALKAKDASEEIIKKQLETTNKAIAEYNKLNQGVQTALDERKKIINRHEVEVAQERTNLNIKERDKAKDLAQKKKEDDLKAANDLRDRNLLAHEENRNFAKNDLELITADETKKADAKVKISALTNMPVLDSAKKRAREISDYEKGIEDETRKDAKILFDQRIAMAGETMNILSDIVGKESAAGKAMAVSSALINTYLGITAGLKLGFPAAIPAVLAASVTGFKAVKNILATKIPGNAGGGSASAPSATSITAPILPQAETTTLSSQSINQIGVASSRAFVLESDVTNNQERMQRLNRAARIN